MRVTIPALFRSGHRKEKTLWNDRLHSQPWYPTGVNDRFAVRRLVPEAGGPMDALRELLELLFERSGAAALPDPDGARGRPVRVFPDLATYQRQVLQVTG